MCVQVHLDSLARRCAGCVVCAVAPNNGRPSPPKAPGCELPTRQLLAQWRAMGCGRPAWVKRARLRTPMRRRRLIPVRDSGLDSSRVVEGGA